MVEKILDKEIEEKVLKATIQLSWISGTGMWSLSGPGACIRRIIGRRERH